MSQPPKQRKVKVYGSFMGASASSIYMADLKRMEKKGWRLVSCTEIGKGRLNAIYVKD